jgi:hypothetical protein
MGNELAIVNTERYLALADGSDLREAIVANAGVEGGIAEQDLVRIPTPAGGATTWAWDSPEGAKETKELTGILVGYFPRGVLWPSLEPTDSRPLLVSYDLVTAHKVGDDFGDIDADELAKYQVAGGGYDWKRLPWNEWGSGKNGIGKRCKESRIMFLLMEGDAFPVLVQAQPGSLKTIPPFIVKLPVPHWRAVVALTLQAETSKGGQKFAQIKPRLVGQLTREQGAVVKEMYTDSLAKMVRSLSFERDEEAGGEV